MNVVEQNTVARDKIGLREIQNTPFCGCACSFVPIDERRGIKFYPSAGERDLVMSRQKLGAMYGFAPKVYETVDLPEIGYYGFVVELVRIAKYWLPEKYRGNPCSWDYHRGYESNSAYDRDKYALIEQIDRRLGFYMTDPHANNIAFNEEGRMVIVDWGTESQGEQRG